MGFDILEISSGFITIPVDDWLRLVEKVQHAGLKARPEVAIQFGAGPARAPAMPNEIAASHHPCIIGVIYLSWCT